MTNLKHKIPKKDISWWQNFRRWSTRVYAGMAALSIIEWLPEIVSALTGSAALWKPLMSPTAYAATVTALSVLGVIVRNLKQRDVT